MQLIFGSAPAGPILDGQMKESGMSIFFIFQGLKRERGEKGEVGEEERERIKIN